MQGVFFGTKYNDYIAVGSKSEYICYMDATSGRNWPNVSIFE